MGYKKRIFLKLMNKNPFTINYKIIIVDYYKDFEVDLGFLIDKTLLESSLYNSLFSL